ncbi:Efflux pump membrane transporter BepE [Hartmannibacter diazotrophicus]|uniref:Efflux pump membrane transporter BepE n=1 Tax=Hartmannibacter diazotrophicus TaxID=1482074 RepID=A0A2C9D065_9HYPH|nr:efflux RND transporter permease subunit [Hartmannibacter diazotrophicus]SON53634.1 Efflux pump membrane transporter BepE [Hartmannibacter diazotrophicus]
MNFSELFIRRPVLTIVVSLMILLLGAQGITNMSIRQYPKVEETVISVTTTYAGASADLMQGFITTPIAKSVASAEGVDYITSSSRLSTSVVQVHMRLNTDPDSALTEVIAKVQQVKGELPDDADDPIIQKGTGQQFALMYLTVQSTVMTAQEMTEYITRVVQPRFATVPGVADAQVLGGQNFAMRVWIDPIRLASRGVTASEVYTAISNSNFLSAPGKTKNELVAYAIETKSTLQTPEAFGALPIRSNGDEVVRLRDVASIELAAESDEVKVRFNGKEGVFIGIFASPSANPLDTAAAVVKEVPNIQEIMPRGTSIQVVYDSTKFITASIEEVFRTIGEAVVIVIVVILLFLGSFRSVLIPIATIPLSLIGVCFMLYALGYSLNTLTLLAMVLAIGLVVDDAIVVVENIHRHIEEGKKPIPAAIEGMREIFGPVVAMTITLAAVYAPIAFTQGLTGSLFREFAVALAGSVIISGFVAVTLSPMMGSRLLTAGGGRFQHFVDHRFERLADWYGRRLTGSLEYRPVTLLVVVALLATTVFLFLNTTTELAPEEDQGFMFGVVTGPQYATSDYTSMYVDQIQGPLVNDIPEIDARFAITGADAGNQGFAGFGLKPWGERERSQAEVMQEIQGRLGQNAGLQAFVFAPPTLPGSGGGLPIQYVVQSTNPADRVYEIAEQIKNQAQASGKFIIVQDSLSFEAPQVRVLIDRDRAAALGVSVREIGTTLNLLVGGASISKFDRDSRSYDIITQVPRKDRQNPENLGQFFVRSESGSMVPLSSVVKIETVASAPAIEQFNQLNSATISALPLPTVSTGDGLAELERIGQEVMPEGYYVEYSGQSRIEKEAGNALLVAFGLAVIVIYLVLAAQFESFRDPLIIMMSVPLSIFGAIVFLNVGLGTLNIYTQVGLITLVGLITKHGILMVEFANQQRELHHLSKHDAIIEAAKVRLRPILMTTAAMVVGMVPLIMAEGAGAAARYSIGLVIATGMSIGTLFTLFVVPMFYSLLGHADRHHEEEDDTVPVLAAPAE